VAAAGLFCGILAVVLSYVPGGGRTVALVLSIFGIILSCAGFFSANRTRGQGRGMAVAGLIISLFALFGVPFLMMAGLR
jgi:hypothetical protein